MNTCDPSAGGAPASASLPLPPPLPEHPRAPLALGFNELWSVLWLNGVVLAFRPKQITRRRIAALYSGCPELLTATWPNRRGDSWDAMRAAESIVIACGHAGILWPSQLEKLGLNVRYRWRDGHGHLRLVTPSELDRLTAEAIGRPV